VVIVHTGGCKFMKCEKCSYEFCWWCLDEFYTEYHFHHTNCPFRWYVLHGIEVILGLFILLKVTFSFPILALVVKYAMYLSFSVLFGLTITKF